MKSEVQHCVPTEESTFPCLLESKQNGAIFLALCKNKGDTFRGTVIFPGNEPNSNILGDYYDSWVLENMRLLEKKQVVLSN